MDKILVVLTGGTIGSKSENGTVNINSASAYQIVDYYNKEYGNDVDFEVIQPVNYELGNEKSNGIVNLRSAVVVIKSVKKGVFVAFSNNKGENDVYIATRIVESDPYLDQYRSFDGKPWG